MTVLARSHLQRLAQPLAFFTLFDFLLQRAPFCVLFRALRLRQPLHISLVGMRPARLEIIESHVRLLCVTDRTTARDITATCRRAARAHISHAPDTTPTGTNTGQSRTPRAVETDDFGPKSEGLPMVFVPQPHGCGAPE